jgi:multimeric flavodoxin WrbA
VIFLNGLKVIKTPGELNEIVDKADAYVLGAPLYYLDVNGLTKD